MFSISTQAAPGRDNEDFVIATADLAVVVDGAGNIRPHGCHHGIAWYARELGLQTVAALAGHVDRPLTEGLARAIGEVTALHQDSCDLRSGGTPCAAIGIVRVTANAVDALSLSDVAVVVETHDGPQVTCDLSMEGLCGSEPVVLAGLGLDTPDHATALAALVERQTGVRNREHGWWIAGDDPQAAYHAAVASYARQSGRRVAAMSDGATRPVAQMGLYDWVGYLDLLGELGPAGLIARVREIEAGDPVGVRFPRTKRHDDATVAYGTLA